MILLRSLSGFFLTLLILSGCKTLEENQASAKMVIQYSVAKYIDQAGNLDAQIERASRVRSIAEETLKLTQNSSTTLDAIQAVVRAQLDQFQLSSPDRLLAENLITLIAEELGRKFQQGILPPDQMVQVRAVLGWVVEAADYSIPLPPA